MSAQVAPASMEVSVKAGRIEIRSAAVDVPTVISGDARIDADGVVHSRSSSSLVIACPVGTDLVIGTKSGSVTCTGQFGAVSVTAHSGTIRIGACRSADLRTMSGSITVGPVTGNCRVSTASGRVHVIAAHRCDVTTHSGGVSVDGVQDCTVHSASGHATVVCTGPGAVNVHTISGSIDLSYPRTFAPVVTAARDVGRVVDRLRADVPRLGTARVASSAGSVKLHNG